MIFRSMTASEVSSYSLVVYVLLNSPTIVLIALSLFWRSA